MNRIEDMEAFMRRVAQELGCLPSYADPLHGNAHIFEKIKVLKRRSHTTGSTCTKCGLYLAGHATGSADICTCPL